MKVPIADLTADPDDYYEDFEDEDFEDDDGIITIGDVDPDWEE